MSQFMQYAVAASQEALEDAGWKPVSEAEREMTVLPVPFPQSVLYG